MSSIILRSIARALVALMLLESIFLLARGHNVPGGGFVGGLVAAASFVLYGLADGPRAVTRALRVDPRRLAFVGLGIALLAGLVSAFAGAPLLTGLWPVVDKEGTGLALGTPLLFDIGVYLVVLGSVLAILLPLEDDFH